MAIPVILKGDTSAKISLSVADGWDFSAVVLEVGFCGTVTTIVEPVAGSVIDVAFTAEQSALFPLGTHKVTMVLRNDGGGRCTLPWGKIKVTDAPGEVYDAAISVDPGTIAVDDATAADSLGDVKAKLNKVLDYLRGVTVGLMVACVFPCFGGVHSAVLNDLPGTANVVTNVDGFATADDLAGKRDKTDLKVYEIVADRVWTVAELVAESGWTVEFYDYPQDDVPAFWLEVFQDGVFHSSYPVGLLPETVTRYEWEWPPHITKVVFTRKSQPVPTVDRLATTGEVAAVTAEIPQMVTNAVRAAVNTVWDPQLGVAWEARMHDGALYYIAVTNRQEVAE